MIEQFGSEAHECTDCESRQAHKSIAHKDALDDPVGHLCLHCYSRWMQTVASHPICAICGEDPDYTTVREVSDLGGETVLTTGNIGFCETHAKECDNLRSRILAK